MHCRGHCIERWIMWWVWERRRNKCTETSTIPLVLQGMHNTMKGLQDLEGGASYAMSPCLELAEPQCQHKTLNLSPHELCVFVGHKMAILSGQRVRLACTNTLGGKNQDESTITYLNSRPYQQFVNLGVPILWLHLKQVGRHRAENGTQSLSHAKECQELALRRHDMCEQGMPKSPTVDVAAFRSHASRPRKPS